MTGQITIVSRDVQTPRDVIGPLIVLTVREFAARHELGWEVWGAGDIATVNLVASADFGNAALFNLMTELEAELKALTR
jgi:hypothetical protein